jgi:hypothetical protein
MARLVPSDDRDAVIVITDAIQYRSFRFWMRGSQNLWPQQVQGQVLLAQAVLTTGQALFGKEWDALVPMRSMLPTLLPRPDVTPFVRDGFAAECALGLIRQYRPAALREGVVAPPLTEQEWHVAFELYAEHQWPAFQRATAMMSQHILPRMMAALANGLLVASCRIGSRFVPIHRDAWIDEKLACPRFVESQMNPSDPDKNIYPTLWSAVFDRPPPELLPGNAWVFVTAESLQSFISQLNVHGAGSAQVLADNPLPAGILQALMGLAERIVAEHNWPTPTQRDLHGDFKAILAPRGYSLALARLKGHWPAGWKTKRGPRKKMSAEQHSALQGELGQELGRRVAH